MPHVNTNKIEIEYDTFGKNSDRPLLLIIGLGTQVINWHDGFCRKLVDKGHFVIRFDNRDAGKSSHLDQLGMPDLQDVMTATQEGGHYVPPYTLADMAADAIPGSTFLTVEGLGHGMVYADTWDEIVDAITEHTEKAEMRI